MSLRNLPGGGNSHRPCREPRYSVYGEVEDGASKWHRSGAINMVYKRMPTSHYITLHFTIFLVFKGEFNKACVSRNVFKLVWIPFIIFTAVLRISLRGLQWLPASIGSDKSWWPSTHASLGGVSETETWSFGLGHFRWKREVAQLRDVGGFMTFF